MTTASNIVQNVLAELGQVDPVFGLFTATGGSATTFINTNFANYENPPDTDAFKNYLAIVVRDAAGAGADPEGRWAICSAVSCIAQSCVRSAAAPGGASSGWARLDKPAPP